MHTESWTFSTCAIDTVGQDESKGVQTDSDVVLLIVIFRLSGHFYVTLM